MNDYIYADLGDNITNDFIHQNFSNDYWNESEVNALKQIFDYIDKDSCYMLDLGCGMGRLFSFFIDHVHYITGLEPDFVRYQAASREAKKLNQNITVVNGDIQTVRKNTFDFIFISHVFQHIPIETIKEMISTINHILKPNGILAITTTYTEKEDNIFSLNNNEKHTEVDFDVHENDLNDGGKNEHDFYVRNFSYSTIEKLFEKDFVIEKIYGFHYLNTDSIDQDNIHNQKNDLKNAVDVLYILKRK